MNHANSVASLQSITLDVIGNKYKISEENIQQLPISNHIKRSLQYRNILADLKSRSIKMDKQYTVLIDGKSQSYNQPHDEIFNENGVACLKKSNNFKLKDSNFVSHYSDMGCFVTKFYQYFLDENIDINFRLPVLSEVIKTYNLSINHIHNIAEQLLPFIVLCVDLDKIALTTKQKIIIAKQILSRIKEQKLNNFSLYKILQEIDRIEKTTGNIITAEQILFILDIKLSS